MKILKKLWVNGNFQLFLELLATKSAFTKCSIKGHWRVVWIFGRFSFYRHLIPQSETLVSVQNSQKNDIIFELPLITSAWKFYKYLFNLRHVEQNLHDSRDSHGNSNTKSYSKSNSESSCFEFSSNKFITHKKEFSKKTTNLISNITKWK